MAERAILHVDMDAFFASIAQRDDPSLRGKPVLTGGTGPRGVVTTASYEARPYGCRSAMPMGQALRLCPHAVCVKVPGVKIKEASRAAFAVMQRFTDRVQPLSVDEAFLNVTGSTRLFGSPVEMAERIRAEIVEATGGLTASVGVASNKFLAKLASDMDKPDGLTVITAETMERVLTPLPVERLWGVGPASARKLHAMGLRTFGDLASYPDDALRARLGDWGAHLQRLSRGIDDRPVRLDRSAKSIGQEQTFGEDLTDRRAVRGVLLGQCEHVAYRLRKAGLYAGGVAIKVREGDYTTHSRSATLSGATDSTRALWRGVSGLFEAWADERFVPVRLIGCTAERLTATAAPAGLFDDVGEGGDATRQAGVDRAVDAIVGKYGKGAVRRGGG